MDSASASAYGPTVFYFYEQSYDLAWAVFDSIFPVYKAEAERPDAVKRGAKWQQFMVNRVHDCPSVLIESGFISNPSDLELLISAEYRAKFCQAIADGVVDYFS